MRSSPRREISSHSATRVVMAFFGLDGYGSSLSDSSDVEDVEYDERGEIIVKPKAAATRDEPRGDDDDGTCHCFDDLLWYFAWQHTVIAEDAATREYHPIAPQRLKRRGRAAAAAAAEGDDDAFDDDDDDRN